MNNQQICDLIAEQKKFFNTATTIPIKYRLDALKKLHYCIKTRESEICAALSADLGKSAYESFMCEVGLVLSEISWMIRNTPKLAKPKKVASPITQFHSKSFVIKEPFGTVLIMSPWNYPFMLAMDPLVDALAAGNTAVIKPSAYSPATSRIVEKIVSECFEPEYVAVVTGGRAENTELLNQKFDMVFFTGSQNVGREVLRRSAENAAGGCVPNVALDLKRIVPELAVSAIGKIGKDAEGEFVTDILKAGGVSTTGLAVMPGEKTTFTEVMSVPGGQRTFFVYPGSGADFGIADMDFEVLPEIVEALQKRIDQRVYGYTMLTDDYKKAVSEMMQLFFCAYRTIE